MPLLFADCRRPLHGRINASDAEGSNFRDHGGFGVCYCEVEPQAASLAGRIADKWRYDCEEFVSARRHALDLEHRFLEEQLVSCLAGSCSGEGLRSEGARALARLGQSGGGDLTLKEARSLGFFEEVPVALTWPFPHWTTAFSGRFQAAQDIFRGEEGAVRSRPAFAALLWALRRTRLALV